MPAGSTQLDERPGADGRPEPDRRWLGFAPRTVIVVGVLLAVVMVAEYVWLYDPFGSGSGMVSTSATTVDPGAEATTDPGLGSTDATTDPGAGNATPTPDTYATLGNVVIRATPARSGAVLGKIPKGTRVAVTCVATGESVRGATRADDHWDSVTYDAVTGYVSNTLMATGAAVEDPTRIPAC